MDVLNNILFFIHLLALGLGGVASFGIPVAGRKMAGASPEMRPVLFSVMMGLSGLGRAGLGLLLVSGPILFWLKWDFSAPNVTWFAVKMVLVVILFALVIFSGTNARRAQGGDRAAGARQPQIGIATLATFVLIILAAVFAFEA